MIPFSSMESPNKYQLQAKESGMYLLSNIGSSEI